jgi:hypothetical protein
MFYTHPWPGECTYVIILGHGCMADHAGNKLPKHVSMH